MEAVNPSEGSNVVWRLLFEKLPPESSKLMSLLCFLAPNGIPHLMLQPDPGTAGELSDSFSLYHDGERYVK